MIFRGKFDVIFCICPSNSCLILKMIHPWFNPQYLEQKRDRLNKKLRIINMFYYFTCNNSIKFTQTKPNSSTFSETLFTQTKPKSSTFSETLFTQTKPNYSSTFLETLFTQTKPNYSSTFSETFLTFLTFKINCRTKQNVFQVYSFVLSHGT